MFGIGIGIGIGEMNNLTLEQLQLKLASHATGILKTVLTNQIERLLSQLQALILQPRQPITIKRLTTRLQQI